MRAVKKNLTNIFQVSQDFVQTYCISKMTVLSKVHGWPLALAHYITEPTEILQGRKAGQLTEI